MKIKNFTDQLNDDIQQLKEEQAFNGKLLIKQFQLTYDSLKPVNLLKSTLSEVASSPYLIDNIIGASVGMASGYLSKKIVVAGSDNKFRRLVGSILQFGVTNLIAKNPEALKPLSKFIYQHVFLHKKKQIPTE
jgi:hypothetical protein